MLNQQALKKKLSSTLNIQHIAEAIELVSNVKLQKLLTRMEHFRHFALKLQNMIENITDGVDKEANPFFEVRERKNILVIVITSDKGLCGSYNASLLKHADHFLNEQINVGINLTLFGQKSVDHYIKKSYEIKNRYISYAPQITETNVAVWCKKFTESFEKKEVDEVFVIYTHYKNLLTRDVKIEKILPLQKENNLEKEKLKFNRSDYIFEPETNKIYPQLISYALHTQFESLLLESLASELSSRRVAMKAASTNAEDMITKLTLIKNKIRQFSITKEILEINAGAEGVS